MISLCMIVKDEESCLSKSLQSAANYFDDIIITDTGSKDRTKDVSLQYGARVYDFEWISNFSAARNFCAEKAKYDWIFFLDADEVISIFDADYIREFIKNPHRVGSIVCRDADNAGGTGYLVSELTRLYNRRFFCFFGSIHEQIKPYKSGLEYEISSIPIMIDHNGYLPEIMNVKNKFERNRQMLQNELQHEPNNPYLLYQLGRTYFAMSRDVENACLYFEMSLALKPNLRLDYVYTLIECYGYALLRCGKYKESLKIIDYSEYYRHKPNFRFLLAHIYQNNSMLIEAVECFESCIGCGCETPGIDSYLSYYNIGVILEVAGMTSQAILYYQKCGAYKPAMERIQAIK